MELILVSGVPNDMPELIQVGSDNECLDVYLQLLDNQEKIGAIVIDDPLPKKSAKDGTSASELVAYIRQLEGYTRKRHVPIIIRSEKPIGVTQSKVWYVSRESSIDEAVRRYAG